MGSHVSYSEPSIRGTTALERCNYLPVDAVHMTPHVFWLRSFMLLKTVGLSFVACFLHSSSRFLDRWPLAQVCVIPYVLKLMLNQLLVLVNCLMNGRR